MDRRSSTNNVLWMAHDFQVPPVVWEGLKALGYQVIVADEGDGRDLMEYLDQISPRACVIQVKDGGLDSLSFMVQLTQKYPELSVVLIGMNPDIAQAVEAIRLGAADYLPATVPGERIKMVLERALALPGQKRFSDKKKSSPIDDSPMIVEDQAMKAVLAIAQKVAPKEATVLLQGESGTGKEVLAKYIHRHSSRRYGPFVAVNCAALPENLLESELFGHEKGAFTGAVSRKEGKFELASGGTLLLDEVSEMPLALQAKLLRALQEREIDRVGGRSPISVDVRVVATTNRDLEAETREGRFRLDLFYRLNVVPLYLPPLRERPDDIIPLARHFLEKQAARYSDHPKRLSKDAEAYLLKQPWPGNVRQLENLMERVYVLVDSETITGEELERFSDSMSKTGQRSELGLMPLREMEKNMILRALKSSNGNRTHAAKALGISVRTLRNKLNEYQRELGHL